MSVSHRLTLGFNGRFLLNNVTGVERFARNILSSIIPLADERGYTCKIFTPKIDNIRNGLDHSWQSRLVEMPLPIGLGNCGKAYWEQILLPMAATANAVTVLINLTNHAPVLFQKNIMVVHDLAWATQYSGHKEYFKFAYRTIVPAAIKRAARIVTVSSFSKSEIVRLLKIAPSKIEVVSNGVGKEFYDLPKETYEQELNSLCISRPYFLHVGSPEPRKNLDRLLSAFRSFAARTASPPMLVMAGAAAKHFKQSLPPGIVSDRNVLFLGYVQDQTLKSLYSGALATVSASLYEGFGLPILESMACGTAVLASDIPPYREIIGDDAVFFNPLDTATITNALSVAVKNPVLLHSNVCGALERAKLFTWENSATCLLGIIERVAHDRRVS